MYDDYMLGDFGEAYNSFEADISSLGYLFKNNTYYKLLLKRYDSNGNDENSLEWKIWD